MSLRVILVQSDTKAAQSFNSMVAGLQEGSIYRDSLGRTVSPPVREQFRQTFTSGSLRLEGQQAVATVLQWLNEYFAQVVPIVAAHGGVLYKFAGDAVLAFLARKTASVMTLGKHNVKGKVEGYPPPTTAAQPAAIQTSTPTFTSQPYPPPPE
jgi:hypothetical protein